MPEVALRRWLFFPGFLSANAPRPCRSASRRARYYDPTAGRFKSEDPIQFLGGINFYAYVGNNVTNRLQS
jgi:RHS repeat-associated protein